ncbi:ROK family protein [Bacillus sp. 165]|uniref:ROK family protein n=1 Tax=Bacillus sp. 165 TaxID=1529117 RepID=UPI001ADD4D12|nr:ROK family protein [Bacillus sp. 165]MBO9130010.1 ROK family protein [Bacillus sp. 165]
MNYVVMDIGGSSIKHAVMNEKAECLTSEKTVTPKQGEGLTFPCLIQIIEDYKQHFQISGVALSVSGAVDPVSGYVYFAGAVTDLMHKNVKEELQCVNLPVELDNDVNCVTLAEKWMGHATECQSFVCIAAGTGIGGGIFINGELYRGNKGMAGEFGLMTLHYNQELETAIDQYSYSNLGSSRALVANASKKLGYPVTGEVLFELAEQGNEQALAALDEFYNALAIGAANIIHALAPEKVLIGGGISAQRSVIDEVKERIRRIREEALDVSEIDRCYFQNDAGKVGALYHFLKSAHS